MELFRPLAGVNYNDLYKDAMSFIWGACFRPLAGVNYNFSKWLHGMSFRVSVPLRG